MNVCNFSGRLVADPELRTFQSGNRKVNFRIAVNARVKDRDTGEWKDDPSFLHFEAWDTGADLISKYYRKGDFILIPNASIKTERWTDKEGKKRERLTFRCDHFELIPGLNVGKGSRGPKQDEDREPEPAGVAGGGDDQIPF